jgi:hypothetical protein
MKRPVYTDLFQRCVYRTPYVITTTCFGDICSHFQSTHKGSVWLKVDSIATDCEIYTSP